MEDGLEFYGAINIIVNVTLPIIFSFVYLMIFEKLINPVKYLENKKSEIYNIKYQQFNFDSNRLNELKQEINELKQEIEKVKGQLENMTNGEPANIL